MTSRVKPYALVSLFALAAGALFMNPTTAQACTQDTCKSPVRLVSNSGPIPGDLLFFEVLVDDPGALSLHTKDGSAIAASVRMIGDRRVFAPTGTVPAGTKVVLQYICTLDTSEVPAVQSWEYTTGPAVGVPQLSDPELTFVDQTTSGEWVSANLRYLEPTPDSASHLTYSNITVDGMDLSILAQAGHVGGSLLFEVMANCTSTLPRGDTCGFLSAVPPGTHEVAVRTTVVGVAEQPNVVKLSIDLKCPTVADSADAGPRPTDGGVLIPDASTQPTDMGVPTADAGRRATDFSAPIADDGVLTTGLTAVSADGGSVAKEARYESGSDGCAVGAKGASSGLSWAVLASGVALILRTRSRHPGRHSRKP